MHETNPLEDPRHYPGTALWLGGALLVVLLAMGLYFREAKPPAGGGAKVADVTKSPEEFVGRTVTVQGAVEEVLGPRAFILEDEGPGSEMLVVASGAGASRPATEFSDIDDVRVVGEVRLFDTGKVQNDIGIPATDERLKKVSGKPVLYAFQVIVPPAKAEAHARSDSAD